MNIICLTGNLCKDIELKYTKNNKRYVENTIAVQKGNKNKDGEYESDFIDIVVFEQKAEYISNYAKKGNKIEINGKLRVDNWKDDKGDYHTRSYVVADSITILTPREKTKTDLFETPIEVDEEELPF
jgi:single-strand DNA-binding protein